MKYLICTILTIVLFNCELKTIESYGQYSGYGTNVYMQERNINGMVYHVYTSAASYGGVFVINHTKELLEVEKIKRELNK